jgi:hypothetical protein
MRAVVGVTVHPSPVTVEHLGHAARVLLGARSGLGDARWRRSRAPNATIPGGVLLGRGGDVGRGTAEDEDVRIDVAARLAPYDIAEPGLEEATGADVDDEFVERAAALLTVMPPRQARSTIEQLVAPDDLERGRRAVSALIDSAFAAEDESGRLVLLA